jgi:hypothetical protein
MGDDSQNNLKLRARGEALFELIRARTAEVQRAISMLPIDSALRAELEAAGSSLASVEESLALALASPNFPLRSADLIQIGNTVTATSVANLVAEAMRGDPKSAERIGKELAAATAATRTTVTSLADDLFGRRIFDAHLHFDSDDEKEAYRRREAERQRYLIEQLGRKTPQGDLNAAAAASGQMLDAHAYGAGNSPEWHPRWEELTANLARQRAAMKAAGHSTEEADAYLRNEVRRFLKAKGLTDDAMTAQIASAADPLEAMKPFLGKDGASRDLEKSVALKSTIITAVPQLETDPSNEKPVAALAVDLNAIASDLKAAGVMTDVVEDAGHGLGKQDRGAAPTKGGRVNS